MSTGIGLCTAPTTSAVMGAVPDEKQGVASAVNDATREIGAALGTTKQSAWEAHTRWIDHQAGHRGAYGQLGLDDQQAAAARALDAATAIDPRRADQVPSTKGAL